MNRDIKTAIFIAPFLIVGGYIAADYYDVGQKQNQNLFKLELTEACDLSKNPCLLSHKQLLLSLSDSNGFTQINSSHALESIVISVLDDNNKEKNYTLNADIKFKQWSANTQLSKYLKTLPELKIRLISTVNNGYYFSEFYSRKQ